MLAFFLLLFIFIVSILLGLFIFILSVLVFLSTHSPLPIEVRLSPLYGGRGVFALKSFQKGHTIEVAPLIKINRERDLKTDSVLNEYDIAHHDGQAIMLGYASLYNHSDDNNAEWHFTGEDSIIIIANKAINKDDEIFVNYGNNYWKNRDDKI
jgi:SET domain-containing protein